MKSTRCVNLVIVFMILFLSAIPNAVTLAHPTRQSGSLVTATGKISYPKINLYLSMKFIFDPAGGPVTGSMQGSGTLNMAGITGSYSGTGTLTGDFEGGDGGKINGDATLTITQNGASATTNNSWEGSLNANGTGSGHLVNKANGLSWGEWEVAFSADEFQAAMVNPTPTSFDVVALKVDLDPTVLDYIANSRSLNDATKAIINQDSSIIARDANNKFYAINNAGESIALPSTLNSYFQMSDQFAILGNDELLASSEHGSIRGTINGGGDFVMLQKIPDELKTRDYAMLTTSCPSATECRPEMKINSTASSTYIQADSIGSGDPTQCKLGFIGQDTLFVSYPRSSEHGSIRGTINGGG
jgi:hypothetical protein